MRTPPEVFQVVGQKLFAIVLAGEGPVKRLRLRRLPRPDLREELGVTAVVSGPS